ncbi:UNVERIFIED_CONTAM: hypothetical protein PYX00_007269 [Menopon gallinae]|uniref:PPM-type phosphatase domain-containing protein n=1 Tax=Menopon gallinae TaxID=328185 RepID=A0AAW2HJ45_9NEOP
MGAFLDKPNTDKHNEYGNGNGLRYGIASMQGWRQEMEDAHQAIIGLPGAEDLRNWSFFAVFDGHCGAKVSGHCAEHLLESILQTEEFQHAEIAKGIRSGFLRLDNVMRSLPELASGEDKSGSTAVCALISPEQIFIANCGDSRALLCRKEQPLFSTQDHKPVSPMEKERIQKAGGTVMIQRVNGSLAVSRALGDYEYKNVEGKGQCEQLVSPEPEVYVLERNQEADEFLVLACDGIWDVMTNENLCDFVRSRLLISDDLQVICNQVVDTCLHKGSRDNMSIVLVTFPAAPKVSQVAVEKERELESVLEKKIRTIIGSREIENFSDVLHAMQDESIPNLPPGGDLDAKRDFMEKIFNEIHPCNAES